MSPNLRKIHKITNKKEAFGLEGKEKSRLGRIFWGLAEEFSKGDGSFMVLRGRVRGAVGTRRRALVAAA